MQVIPNARKIALTAYSMWASYLGFLCLILPELIFWIWGVDTNPVVWWSFGVGLALFGMIGRFVVQDRKRGGLRPLFLIVATLLAIIWASMSLAMSDLQAGSPPDPAPAVQGLASDRVFLEVAVPFVGQWEGLELVSYRDIVGVWTVCYGETKGIRAGVRFSKAQCNAMLARELLSYRGRLHRYFTDQTKAARLPVRRDLAYVSLAYNAGVAGIGKSTAVRRLNAGDIAGGCTALTWWNKAGQRVIRGLVRRRAAEYELCMVGVGS